MKKTFTICFILILMLGIAQASEMYAFAYVQAQSEASQASVKVVESIDLDEFTDHFGLTLSEEEKVLIKTAMLAYTNGSLHEHPFGANGLNTSHAATKFDNSTETNTYIGNKSSKKFHEPYCSSVTDMKEKNKVVLHSREEAIKKGYTPCKKCNP